jgi:Aldo/keto reductase family
VTVSLHPKPHPCGLTGALHTEHHEAKEQTVKIRKLGKLEVSAVGFGAMGFSHRYGPGPGEEEAIELMRRAHELGCTFYDTAEGYGAGHNGRLVGRALAPIRDEVAIATKLHITKTSDDMSRQDLSRKFRHRLDASLARLGFGGAGGPGTLSGRATQPGVNLGGGGWPDRFYAGGKIYRAGRISHTSSCASPTG